MDSEIIVFGHHSHWPGNTLLMGQHLTYHDILLILGVLITLVHPAFLCLGPTLNLILADQLAGFQFLN